MKKVKIVFVVLILLTTLLSLFSCSDTEDYDEGTDEQTHVHDVTYWRTETESGCENSGISTGICSICKKSVKSMGSGVDNFFTRC